MLKLRLLDVEPGAAWRYYPAAIREVRVGRDPEHCDFVLAAADTSVSRQHCALQLVLGRYRLVLNQENPVFVDGKRAFEGQVLHTGSVLQLGNDGPRVQLAIVHDAALPDTRVLECPPASPQDQLDHIEERLEKRLTRHGRWTWLAIVLVVAASGYGAFRLVHAESALASLGEKQISREERLALHALLTPKKAPETFADVLRRVHDSVYLVMRLKNDVACPIGTAWVVDREKGLLATNAHVVADLEVSGTLVRSSATEPVDLLVASLRQHPGYERFSKLAVANRAGGPVSPGSDAQSLITGCDMALLEIREADRARLGPALPIARQETLSRLGQGTPVAYLGHPLEGLPGNYQRPEARAQIGHVTAVSDFFLGSCDPRDSQLILTNLPATGGASGSPIFNDRGEVVAVLSAASFVSVAGRRIPIGVGLTYGQRADLLGEMLGEEAEILAAQAARDPIWERAFEAIRARAGKELRASLIELFGERLKRQKKAVKSVETVLTTRERLDRGEADGAKDYDLHLVGPGSYLVLAICDQHVDIDMLLSRGSDIDHDLGPDFFPAIGITSRGGEDLKVTVLAKGAIATPIDFELTLVRFAE